MAATRERSATGWWWWWCCCCGRRRGARGQATSFNSLDYYGGSQPPELVASYESQLAQHRQDASVLVAKAEETEKELRETKNQLAVLQGHLKGFQHTFQRTDQKVIESFSKQISTNKKMSDTMYEALKCRLNDAEADVEELFAAREAEDPHEEMEVKATCAELVVTADAASERLESLVEQLEEDVRQLRTRSTIIM